MAPREWQVLGVHQILFPLLPGHTERLHFPDSLAVKLGPSGTGSRLMAFGQREYLPLPGLRPPTQSSPSLLLPLLIRCRDPGL